MTTANGVYLTNARVTVPWRGPMLLELEAPDEVKPAGGVIVVQLNDWAISCALVPNRSGLFAGQWQGLAVSGRAGWMRQVSAKGYRSPAGLLNTQIFTDAAASVGELPPVVSSPKIVGGFYVRQAGEASQVFALLPAGQDWWVDATGVTRVGTRASSVPTTAAITVLEYDRNAGRLDVATESPEAFQPGVTFVDPLVGSVQVNAAVWMVADGKVRGTLWTA